MKDHFTFEDEDKRSHAEEKDAYSAHPSTLSLRKNQMMVRYTLRSR